MAAVFAWGVAHWLGWPTLALAAAGALLALALYVCTAMIYACLPFLQEWHSPLTVVNYLVLGCASGFTLAAAYAGLDGAWASPRALAAGASVLDPARFRDARRVARAQRAAQGALEPAERDRRQAPAHRAEGSGRDRRLVQHARVLPRTRRRRAAQGEVAVSRRRLRRCPRRFSLAGFAEPCLYRSIRRPDGRALVLLRAGEPSAESLLPGGVLDVALPLARPPPAGSILTNTNIHPSGRRVFAQVSEGFDRGGISSA